MSPQGLPEKAAAAERSAGDAEKLCCLSQAEELAVVETVHQGERGCACAYARARACALREGGSVPQGCKLEPVCSPMTQDSLDK